MKKLALVAVCALLCSCQRTPGEVMQKVKYDFGIGEKPEGYVSGAERVMQNLDKVAQTEMKRMNIEGRHGEVQFQEEEGLRGSYYKQVKLYEDFYPLDARATSKAAEGGRGYLGYIEYTYRVCQSERKPNRTEAAAASATIRTNQTGRETFRYTFSPGGVWDGKKGEKTRR